MGFQCNPQQVKLCAEGSTANKRGEKVEITIVNRLPPFVKGICKYSTKWSSFSRGIVNALLGAPEFLDFDFLGFGNHWGKQSWVLDLRFVLGGVRFECP